jgi:hypothetical protein
VLGIGLSLIIASIILMINAAKILPLTLSEKIVMSSEFHLFFSLNYPLSASYFEMINYQVNFDNFITTVTSMEIFSDNVQVGDNNMYSQFIKLVEKHFIKSYYSYSQELLNNSNNLDLDIKRKLEIFTNQYQEIMEKGKNFGIYLGICISAFVLTIIFLIVLNLYYWMKVRDPSAELMDGSCVSVVDHTRDTRDSYCDRSDR